MTGKKPNVTCETVPGGARVAAAAALANSPRGHFIISQALTIAARALSEVPEPHTEHSNIADMRFLRDNLFPLYAVMEEVEKLAEAHPEFLA